MLATSVSNIEFCIARICSYCANAAIWLLSGMEASVYEYLFISKLAILL